MSSRLEEKQRRKAEREAAEREAAQRGARRRRLQIIGAAALGAAVLIAVVFAVSGGGSSHSASPSSSNSPVAADVKGITLPARNQTNLNKAAAAAGCQLHSYPIEGRAHVSTPVSYKTNPPTSGNHNAAPAPDGVYDAASTPAKENYVHSLEHGRVEYQYKPGTPPAQIKQLEAVWNEPVHGQAGYKQLLFQNNTGMAAPVAAVAWGQAIDCASFSPRIFDALRDFRDAYLDKAPEQLPPG